MAITSSDISGDYTINFLSGSVNREDRILSKTETAPPTGAKNVTIVSQSGMGEASYGMDGEVLRISDGSTTIDYTGVITEGGAAASSPVQFGAGGGRFIDQLIDELVSKINSSALDITAVDNGGNSSSVSMTLTPGAGKTLTITEDPGGDNQFGDSDLNTTITDVSGGGSTTTKYKAAPFRFSSHGVFNIRGQSTTSVYKSFVGDQKN